MSEPKITKDAEAELYRQEKAAIDQFVAFIARWPQYRKHAACAKLGSAVAMADMVGEDAEGFIAKLRATHPERPDGLEPPELQ